MPRKGAGGQPTPVSEQRVLMWGMQGANIPPSLTEWDPKTEPLVQAVLEVVATGATLVFRPGSGGRSIGVAIWEGDQRWAPNWVYDTEELDDWAQGILMVAKARKETK